MTVGQLERNLGAPFIIQRDDTDNTYEDWIYFSSEAQVHKVFRVDLSNKKISDIFEESPDRYP